MKRLLCMTLIILLCLPVQYVAAASFNLSMHREFANTIWYQVTWAADANYDFIYRSYDDQGNVLGQTRREHPANSYTFKVDKQNDPIYQRSLYWKPKNEALSEAHKILSYQFPSTVTAETMPTVIYHNGTGTEVDHGAVDFTINYLPQDDVYRVDYQDYPAGTAWYQLHYTSPSGTVYTADYHGSPTGIHYLTCNGTYKLNFFDSNNNLLSSTSSMHTSSINNPTCQSYAGDETGTDDLNIQVQDNGDLTYTATWDDIGELYGVYKDGVYLEAVTDNHYTFQGGGAVQIRSFDQFGAENGRSETFIDASQGITNESGSSCNACQRIREKLDCPYWSEYMGEWQQMLAEVIPPPPDWEEVSTIFANAFINALDDWLGDMPDVPTQSELLTDIEPEPIPFDVDTNDFEIAPDAPEEFDEPFNFDITTGEQFEIVDESQPFDIPEPGYDQNIRLFVYPEDPENEGHGMEQSHGFQFVVPRPTKPHTIR